MSDILDLKLLWVKIDLHISHNTDFFR